MIELELKLSFTDQIANHANAANLYVEIVSSGKVLNNAKMGNQIFFQKLRIE